MDTQCGDYESLIYHLKGDAPLTLLPSQRLLLLSIVENDRSTAIAYAVRRYANQGAGFHKAFNGAYFLAAEECHCSASTAERYYKQDVERAS